MELLSLNFNYIIIQAKYVKCTKLFLKETKQISTITIAL